jgi:hypothetical protein
MKRTLRLLPLAAALLVAMDTFAAVSAEEAAKLKTELTPLGGEKAGNKEGTIPAWAGGYTTPIPGFVNGGKRGDPFANEKPLYSVTAKNMAQYADKLSDGTKAMLQKYPDTFRLDVYTTHRTAAAPRWVYDNTFKNATRATLENNIPSGAYGGIPYPIPKTGEEVIWNHTLRWRGYAYHNHFSGIQLTGEGKLVQTVDADMDIQLPYYDKNGSLEKFDGTFWTLRLRNFGPAIRAGEGVVARWTMDPQKYQTWVYLTGQRRTRKLPNACCDAPSPASAGLQNFDQTDVFSGRTDLFDCKLIGKQEMLVPYNVNRQLKFNRQNMFVGHHVNPDAQRWELHRVWIVEATLKPGKRHVQPKRKFYVDEDTWTILLGDHWDASGRLWQTGFADVIVMPDLPATATAQNSGFYDLLSGAGFFAGLHEFDEQYKVLPGYPESTFTAEGLAADGIR